MKILLAFAFMFLLSPNVFGQTFKAEDIAGKTWHCYTTSDKSEPPWNGKKTFTITFNSNHTYIKKYEGAVNEFGGHWDISYAGTMLQIRGTVTEDHTILFCNEDFLKTKNTTGAYYFYIREQKMPVKE